MKDDSPVLVRTVAERIDFIGGAEHSVEVIKEEGTPRSLGSGTRFGAVYLGGNGVPGVDESTEEVVIVPAVPGVDVNKVFHT